MSWRSARRFEYGIVFLIIFVLVVGFFAYKIFKPVPSCSSEREAGGLPCGGSCQNICSFDVKEPVVLWSKVFHISGNIYTAVAYVRNPNVNAVNAKANYQFKIYDDKNRLIGTRMGQTDIPKNQSFAIFEPGLVFEHATPKRADIEFTSYSIWTKDNNPLPHLNISYSTLQNASTSPHLQGTISNNTLKDYLRVEIDAFIEDENQNVIAAGKTFIDGLQNGSSQDFVFTWQDPIFYARTAHIMYRILK
jgi:hypothetical protein